MTRYSVLLLLFTLLLSFSCQKDDGETRPENDPATALYGIWNRLDFGFEACPDAFDNSTEFGEGSVAFAEGGFYTTYSLRNGQDRVNTVRFEVQNDSIAFLNTMTTWKYEVLDDNLALKTKATNGCVRYFNFVRSSQAL